MWPFEVTFGLPQALLDELDSFREQRLRSGRSAFVRHLWRRKHFPGREGKLSTDGRSLRESLPVGRLNRAFLEYADFCGATRKALLVRESAQVVFGDVRHALHGTTNKIQLCM